MLLLRRAGHRGDARGGEGNAVRPPAACGGNLPEDLKTFQALSYERLQGAFADLFGLRISQGGPMNMLRRLQERFLAERD